MANPLILSLVKDTGVSGNDGITASSLIQVSGLEVGTENTWQYSIDAGKTWSSSIPVTASNNFEVPDGLYESRQIRARQQIVQPIPKGNLIVNGSFEQGWVGNSWTGLTSLPGWKTADRFEIWGKGMTAASDGNYLLEMDYAGAIDFISQSINTTKDARYTLQFDMKSRGGSKESLEVFWRGEKISTVDTSKNNTWTTFTFEVIGSGQSDELKFNELKAENNGLGSLIDNVRLSVASLPQVESTNNTNAEVYYLTNAIAIDRKTTPVTLKTPGGKDGVISSNAEDRMITGTAEAGGIITLMTRQEKSESFESGALPTWINLDIPNTSIANIKFDTKNGELDFSAEGGRTNIWTTRDNAPFAWVSRPAVSQGESWFIETKVRVDKRSQGETISGITFYNDKDKDFQYGAPSFYLDSWHYSGTNVSLQGLGNNNPFVTANNATIVSGDTANIFLRAEITEKGSNDDYKFFYRKLDSDQWTQLGATYSYSIDNSRVALFHKTGSAKQGGSAFDDLKVGKISEDILASKVNVNDSGVFTYSLSESDLKRIGEGSSKSIIAVQSDLAGNIGRSSEAKFSVDTEVTPVIITSIGGGDGRVSSEKVVTGGGPLKLNLDQYTGYWSNKLADLQNYVKNYNPLTSKNKYSVLTDAIDFTDDQGGFAGELSFDKRWPAAEASNYWGTGGINNQFFAKVSGDFSVTTAANYRFRTFNDDGVFLLIDGVLVINDPTLHPERVFTGDITLEPGNHQLELYFFENGGEASLEFSVSTFDTKTNKWSPYQLMGKDPSFTARTTLEVDNNISGTGAPNAKTYIKLGNQELGSTTTDSNGNFEYKMTIENLALLSDNSNGSSLIAYQFDSSGNLSSSNPGQVALTDKPPVVEVKSVGQQDITISNTFGDSEISGRGNPNLMTTLKFGSIELGQALADNLGDYKYVLTQNNLDLIGQGSGKTVLASQKTQTGITGDSKPFEFKVDTISPKVNIDSIGKDGGKISLTHRIISGTGEANSDVSFFLGTGGNEQRIGSVKTNSTGSFNIELSEAAIIDIDKAKQRGTVPIIAKQIDGAGNIGNASSTSYSVKLNSPIITLEGIGGEDAVVSSQTSDLLVNGRAEAGLPVNVWYDNVLLGQTNPSNEIGEFSYNLAVKDIDIIGQGAGKLLTFEQLDEYGNKGINNLIVFSVDTIGPSIEIPRKGLLTSPGGTDGVMSTQDRDAVIQGRGEANQIVELNIYNTKRLITTDSKGDFVYNLTSEDIGIIGQGLQKQVSITQADNAGNSSTIVLNFGIDTIAPAKPNIIDIASGGVVSSITNDNQISGSAEKSSTVYIMVNNNSLNSSQTDEKGNFKYSLTSDDIFKIGQGIATMQTKIVDKAGNVALSDPYQFTIDTISPFTPSIGSIGGQDNIISTKGSGNVTESIDNEIIGTAESGSSVQIYSGNKLLGSTLVNELGSFSYRLTSPNIASLGQGNNKQLHFISVDNAGNSSTVSKPSTFSVDTISPSSPKIQSIGGVDGIISSISLDNTVVGVAEPNSRLQLRATNDDGSLFSVDSILADNKGNWTYSFSSDHLQKLNFAQNSISKPLIQFVANDSAGNESSSVAFTPIIDITAPVISITAIGGSDNILSSKAGDSLISGVGEANGTLSFTVNGKLIGSTKTDSKGFFNYTFTSSNITSIGEGEKQLIVSQVDKAGNQGTLVKGFSVDTVAPGVATIQAIGGFDKLVTSAETDRIVRGKAEAGTTIELLNVSGTKTTTLTSLKAASNGEFSYTLTPDNLVQIGQGVGKSIVAATKDEAGNTSTSKPFSFEVQGLWKLGTESSDQIPFTTANDVITGLGSADRFIISSLSTAIVGGSSIPTFDRLIGYQIGLDQIDAPRAIAVGNVKDVGTLQTLSTLHLGQLLNSKDFLSNSAAVFRYADSESGQRTFLALNDNITGFDSKRDAIIEITGFTGSLGSLSIV